MSLSAYWEPWSSSPRRIKTTTMTDSEFLKALVDVFSIAHGGVYNEDDLIILKAMAAANDSFQELVDAVEQHGTIRVWGEN